METRTLVRAVVVAAFVATLLAGAFHLTVSERFVDRAIRLEEQAEAEHLEAEGTALEHHEPVFSRRTQKAGLLVGLFVYGLGAGAIVAGVYTLWGQRIPGHSARTRILLFGGIAVFSAVLIPFLKYPSNPPSVGDPGTLTQRQLLYIGCLLLSIAGTWIAARVFMRLRRRASTGVAAVGSAAVLALWLVALFLVLPDRTDPVHTPETLLLQFRASSLAGQLIYWATFVMCFAETVQRSGESTVMALPS
jgi:hypothetical protein